MNFWTGFVIGGGYILFFFLTAGFCGLNGDDE